MFILGRFDNGLNFFGDGVEGVEIEDFVFGENRFGMGVEFERFEESFVDGIYIFFFVGSG